MSQMLSRIKLKIDSWENWNITGEVDASGNPVKGDLVLLAGEIAFVQMGTVPPVGTDKPATGAYDVLFKVGDGTSAFKELPWGSAKAADVYGWAKQDADVFTAWLAGGANTGVATLTDPFIVKSVHDAAIATLSNRITTLDGTNAQLQNNLNELSGRVDNLEALSDDVSNFQSALDDKVDQSAYDTKVQALEQADTNLTNTINKLVGTDTDKSIRTIAAEELAVKLIAADAQESLDTLAEIAAWIQSHPDDAAAMNATLQEVSGKLNTLQTSYDAHVAKAVTTDTYLVIDCGTSTTNID